MRLPPSLADPQFRRFTIGNVFAQQGMWAQRTVIAWLAWDMSGSASWAGFVAFLSVAPTFVTGPIFGVIADRTDLRRAAIRVQLALAAAALALLGLIFASLLTLEALAALALVHGVVISAHHPIRLALTPRLAPRAALTNAIAIGSLAFNLARLTGPAMGGYAIAQVGAAWTLAVAAALYPPVIAILAGARLRPMEGAPARQASVGAALTEGLLYAWRIGSLRRALSLIVVFAFTVRGFLELLAVLADGDFRRGAAGFGELMAAAGAGALCAALLLATRDLVKEGHTPPITVGAAFVGFAAAAGAVLAPVWPAAVALTALAGFCGTIVGVSLQLVVQLSVDDAHRGRVLSLWIMVAMGSAVVGALIMGALADLLGLGPVVASTSLIGAAGVAAIRIGAQRRRSSRSSASRKRDLSALEKGRPPPP